jgi:hypothetical protein
MLCLPPRTYKHQHIGQSVVEEQAKETDGNCFFHNALIVILPKNNTNFLTKNEPIYLYGIFTQFVGV